jgi:hypothetical protein
MLNKFRNRDGSDDRAAIFTFNDIRHKFRVIKREFCKGEVILAAARTLKNWGFGNWEHGFSLRFNYRKVLVGN